MLGAMAGLAVVALTATSARAEEPGAAALRCWTAPGTGPRITSCERSCMGTACRLTAFTAEPERARAAFDRGFAALDHVDEVMSIWKPTSTVSRINDGAGGPAVAVDADTMAVLEKSLWIARRTDGAFDITFGAFRGVWKFDEDKDGSLPDAATVRARRRLVNWRDVVLDKKRATARLRRKGQRIDLGGIAKGYAVDRAADALRQAGLVDFMVQAGGDFFAAGKKGDRPWTVGIQDPRGPRHCPADKARDCVFAMLRLTDASFSTSGDYERFVMKDGKRYHHIIDPRTGYPATAARSVTVMAPDAFTADAVDTAFLIVGPERALKLAATMPGVEVVIVDARNRVHVTPRLGDRLERLRDPSDGP